VPDGQFDLSVRGHISPAILRFLASQSAPTEK
jgi:hypothetical protein